MPKYLGYLTLEDNQYSVTFPGFPGCVTCGDTIKEAVRNAREALTGHVAAMKEDGEALPEPVPEHTIYIEVEVPED